MSATTPARDSSKVRKSMKIIAGRVHTQLNSVLNSSRAYLQEAVITMRDGRYCLPVKSEYKNQVPGMVRPVLHRIHDFHRTDGCREAEQ